MDTKVPPLTTVVNIKLGDDFDVYVGRACYGFWDSPFRNPFVIGKHGTRDEVIEKFRVYFLARVKNDREFREQAEELRGKRLGCWCAPGRCHADVIADWLNVEHVGRNENRQTYPL